MGKIYSIVFIFLFFVMIDEEFLQIELNFEIYEIRQVFKFFFVLIKKFSLFRVWNLDMINVLL